MFLGSMCCVAASVSAQSQTPFSIVLLPDTQNYAEKASYGVYQHQTQWIVDNQTSRNIQYVIHLGDITQHDTVAQWQVADAAHDLLDDAGIPYTMASGNHDLYPSGAVYQRESYFEDYFGPQRFAGELWYGGAYADAPENNYGFFEAGGLSFLVLSLEFLPRKDVLAWADDVIASHPARRVIVTTHCHQDGAGDFTTGWADGYNIEGREGVDLWEEFLQRHSTLFMVVSGHIQGVSYRLRTGNAGNDVHHILTDFQSEPVLGTGTALGNGWLRVLTFDPANDSIAVESLSVESGNTAIFPGGTPQLYLNYNQYGNPSAVRHNQQNYSLSYDMHTQPSYQFTVGDELFKDRLANRDLTGRHYRPRIAAADNGKFVVTWEDDRDGNGVGQIYARVFDQDGNALTGEIVVNSDASGQQRNPDVACDDVGNFVVVWEDDKDSNGYYQVYARGFYADGSQRFGDITVNSVGAGQQFKPVVAMDHSSRFVVTWEDDQDSNGYYQILARGFNANGSQRIADFTVNSTGAGQQYKPAIAMDPFGRFVVTWEDDQDNNGYYNILARAFYDNGSQRLADFRVNSDADGQQFRPSIDMDDNGRFVIAWQDDTDNNGYYQIYARGFWYSGSQRFADMTVNSTGAGQQLNPSVGMGAAGGFYVTFEDDNDGNGYYQVFARGFNADGSQRRADFTVNSDASGQQYVPVAAMSDQDYVFIAWQDDMDGDGAFGILVRNFDY